MPKELTLQLQEIDGIPFSDALRVAFDDAEWNQLTRFAEFAAEVAETPVLHHGRGVSLSMNVDFAKGEQSWAVTMPGKVEIQALLHVMRPFVLQDEPTAFNKIVKILARR